MNTFRLYVAVPVYHNVTVDVPGDDYEEAIANFYANEASNLTSLQSWTPEVTTVSIDEMFIDEFDELDEDGNIIPEDDAE